MRVQIVPQADAGGEPLEIPWSSTDPAKRFLDLREDPQALGLLELAQRHRPLHLFLAAVNSKESVFASVRSGAWTSAAEPSNEPCEFTSQVDLIFALEEFNLDRQHWEDVVERLEKLLTREAKEDALRAELRIQPCRFRAGNRSAYALGIALSARGTTSEQAQMRWGLGLARVQQALLFTSRSLRQENEELN